MNLEMKNLGEKRKKSQRAKEKRKRYFTVIELFTLK